MFVVPVHLPSGAPTASRNVHEWLAFAPLKEAVIRFGRCELRTGRRELIVDGVRRHLQPRPFDLLVYLVENGDRVVTSEELLSQVWGDASVLHGSLPAAILRLRRALGRNQEEVIRTYQRVGYRFVAPAVPIAM